MDTPVRNFDVLGAYTNIDNAGFNYGSLTKLTFSAINAFAVFRIHFYPSTLINLARGIQGVSLNRGRNHL